MLLYTKSKNKAAVVQTVSIKYSNYDADGHELIVNGISFARRYNKPEIENLAKKVIQAMIDKNDQNKNFAYACSFRHME